MTDLRQADVAVPKFRSPRPECRWEKADDGALVMVWSIAIAAPPALRVAGGNPKAGRPVAVDEPAKAVRPVRRARSLRERFAIAMFLGLGGYLTLISFTSAYATFP